MKKFSFYISMFLLFCGCEGVDRYSKKDFKGSRIVCDHIYMEYYRVFGSGAFGGDLLSAYVTDSTHFKRYLGKYDYAVGGCSSDCKGDSLVVNGLV
ncbi:hypothetical protein SAMN05428949_0778 [Chitinophaga sp. YR627]|uniref:hypothetical protein n=1 Tax=Chitinophaga sp. YR627 TaxID=1881041 RepID=UPI0008EFBC47|nr:hypothetical protein [Chitinophaga sp. YR627]SFM78442.1 hypothetical protein SAMN05428949_0778 [Chitinophaga sp. YR627]